MEKAELDKRFKKLKSQELEGQLFSQKEEWIKKETEILNKKQNDFTDLLNHIQKNYEMMVAELNFQGFDL